ncbi:MAG TPA: M28 family peptidase [Bryobacterales bacterium]|nr:M28 family peptidase [Bryobacterales bacterium]
MRRAFTRRAWPLGVTVALLLAAAALAWADADAQRYIRDVRTLASPEMKGRGDGSPELEKAARYIAGQFQAAGLQSLNGQSWFQPFRVSTGATLGSNNRFEVQSNGKAEALRPGVDFLPFSFSSRTMVSGEVVFAGYGITAPEYHYDDYAHLDVKGKIVLALRHEPQENDEKSVFLGKDFTRHAEFINKAINARNRGALALVVVNDRAAHPRDEDMLIKFGMTKGPEDAGLPVVQVKTAVADQWLRPAGKTLEALQREIDKTLEPQPLALPASLRLTIGVDLERRLATVNNVIGYLPGATEEHIIIGAHYDHLGLGEHDSLAPSMAGQVHPGADDNASGTAGILELARMFAAQRAGAAGAGDKVPPKRGVVFIAFAGEELGLLGSEYYVNHPLLPLDQAVVMINLDMIGRLRHNKLYVGGVGTGTTFKPLVEGDVKKFAFKPDYATGGYDSSDHTSFTAKQVPVLFFFSGLHSDYHKPSDTWDKIEGPQTAHLLDMVFDLAERLDAAAARPEFVRVADPHSHGTATGSVGGGYGPYFGSIPDFGEVENGVKFADIREGSPAAKAGLKGGDVLVEFDGKPIKNLYDFTYALRSKSVGDTVEVRVLRDGKPLAAKVTLEQRR